MLTESFIAATLASPRLNSQTNASLKDVGIILHEFQPQVIMRHGYKKSSIQPQCLAISDTHIFAAQADKAVINVYNREKGNQEATVPFPEKITSIEYADGAAILVLGTESGRLVLWEVATGRLSNSSASHLQSISSICITPHNDYILSASADSSIHVWSLPNLVSFSSRTDGFSKERPMNTPLNTFSNHRNPVTALTCGHSKANTNFAVSASDDHTCYLWHIATCQVLRTILLPSTPLCAVMDPVDRAVYFGDDQGQILFVNLSGIHQANKKGVLPIEVTEKDSWKLPSADIGSIHCLTLSYDGTSLLSGHSSGKIMQWDVAKGKIANEIFNLAQSVTNITMLKPDGIRNLPQSGYSIPVIVKPKLEFSAAAETGTCGVPARYTIQTSLVRSQAEEPRRFGDEIDAFTSSGFPKSMMDEAIRAIELGAAGLASTAGGDEELSKMERLEDQVTTLRKQLTVLQKLEETRKAKKLGRMQKREEIGLKKRQAYFDAKKKGKDGDAAMKPWEEKESMIDAESDDEGLGEEMDIG